MIRHCLNCQGVFYAKPNRVKKGEGKYCSMTCQWAAKIGKKLSKEHREHISLGQKGIKNSRWKGGLKMNHGYRTIRRPEHARADGQGYVFEHVLIAEKRVGRSLSDYEVAHHVDLDKTNNAPGNIIVMGKAEHMRYHRNLNRLFEHWLGA